MSQLARTGSLALVLHLAGCGDGPPPPAWVDVSRAFTPRGVAELAQELEAALPSPRGARIVRTAEGGGGDWLELPVPRALWSAAGRRNQWTTPRPGGGAVLAADLAAATLQAEGLDLRATGERLLPPGTYQVRKDKIHLSLAAEQEPPDSLLLRVPLSIGQEVDGARHAIQGDLQAAGFLVFPGHAERLRCELPAASRLGFATVLPEAGPIRFRVRLDGRVLIEEQPVRDPEVPHAWYWLDLAGSEGAHELSFEVEGSGPAFFATPVLAPHDPGVPGRRPWPEARPDVVLLLCDTLRADGLEAWGGAPDGAPRLNAFVARSLRFLDARSVAAWTLPSIATILSGVFPAQHGAVQHSTAVSPGAEMLAEVFARAGYRTAAITDAGYFSRHFGQSQGFEWFEETPSERWSLAGTLARARARMAADDGRPLFLVVHTYRVHGPLRVGPDEARGPYLELRRKVTEAVEARRKAGASVDPTEVALEFCTEGVALYRDAVADLDRKLGAWIEELEGDGFLQRGILVLTSDHGEALGEHGQLGHASDLYDVRLRVPLALAGLGIEPGAVPGPVSLLDLAPTLAALAGIPRSPSWVGRSLLGRAPGEPVFAFDLDPGNRQVALYADGRKLMAHDLAALEAGRPWKAFDLASDPAEEHDLAATAAWPGELSRALAEQVAPLLEVSVETSTVELSSETRAQLEAIGYGE